MRHYSVRLVLDLLDLIVLVLSTTIPIGIALFASNKLRKITLVIAWFVLSLWIIFRLIINPFLLYKAKVISTNCAISRAFADLITCLLLLYPLYPHITILSRVDTSRGRKVLLMILLVISLVLVTLSGCFLTLVLYYALCASISSIRWPKLLIGKFKNGEEDTFKRKSSLSSSLFNSLYAFAFHKHYRSTILSLVKE